MISLASTEGFVGDLKTLIYSFWSVYKAVNHLLLKDLPARKQRLNKISCVKWSSRTPDNSRWCHTIISQSHRRRVFLLKVMRRFIFIVSSVISDQGSAVSPGSRKTSQRGLIIRPVVHSGSPSVHKVLHFHVYQQEVVRETNKDQNGNFK